MMNSPLARAAGWLAVVALFFPGGIEAADEIAGETSNGAAARILADSGVQGGLVVHVGCGDGRLTAALRANDGYLVHGLDTDPAKVVEARRHIQSLGVYGPVSVDEFDGRHLPYADNLVNLLVVSGPLSVAKEEVQRVLAPGGVAIFTTDHGPLTTDKTIKPWPRDIDQWTHYLHDAGGNAVAADRQVGPPKHVRWTAGPLWSRSHEYNPSINALVSAGGRMFYLLDEGIAGLPDLRFPERWVVCARDAFSGVLLWKQPLPNWGWREWNTVGMWSAPLTLNRRVVTDGRRVFVTLGYQAPVTVLDAATGRTLHTIAESQGTDEMVLCDGVLLLCVREKLSVASPPEEPAAGAKKPAKQAKEKARPARNPHEWEIGAPGPAAIVAVEAESGKVLWRREPEPVTVLTLAAADGRVCWHGADRITACDLRTGAAQWTAEASAMRGSRHAGGTLVMYENVVLFTNADGLTAFSARDGAELWSGPRVSGPGVTHPADLFVAGGLVWAGDVAGTHTNDRTAVHREGRDPVTGEVKRTVQVDNLISPLHHFRCYRSKATDRYLLLTKRGVEFLDLEGGDHMRNDWLRAMCHYGFLPCNGLLYVPPHHCFCYPGVKLTGFLALAADQGGKDEAGGLEHEGRLEKGPAYEIQNPQSEIRNPSPWPTYRGDPLRSGHSTTAVPAAVQEVWQADVGGKITPPVLADGRVYVAQVDTHRIWCLDQADGKPCWTFTAGARVDSPPTIHEGRVLFGCRDGWVYCLNAADGRLAWRFRAAPDGRRIVAFEQLESPWPVPGSVLVLDGVAYVAAGRSSFLDGGVSLYGLKPQTGEVLYQTRLQGPWPDVREEAGRPFDMEGAKGDILVTDGTHLYLYQMTFDKQLKDVTAERASTLGDRISGRRLIATGGFLDDTWYDRTYWTYTARWPGFYYANAGPKAGQILVFDESTTYGLHVFTERARLSPRFTPGDKGYQLFADDNDNEPVLAPTSIDREKGPGYSRAAPPKWSQPIPLRARAMVLAGDKLFLAGPPDVVPEDDPYAAFEGRRGAQLWCVAAVDGKKLAEHPLASLPVFDGLIAADGRLYLATVDGKLACFGAPGRR
jgi:outer membrane protein assembly factor BamB